MTRRRRHPVSAVIDRLTGLFGGEAGAGFLLMLVAAAALALANSSLAGAYHDLFHYKLPASPIAKLDTLHAWINDGLMAVFFFVVGLEIKREVLDGELARPTQRRLPVLAALLGMIAPALVYLAATWGQGELTSGWAIPAATDIAFAVGVIALVGKGLPPSLRLFLLTVAIVDDLGAVFIIALFYTRGVDLMWLAAAGVILAALIGCNLGKVRQASAYALGGTLLWFCVLHSGIHATIAGVAAALTVPLALNRRGDSPLLRMEHGLTPVSAYLVVPLFGLANAGVELPHAMPQGAALLLPLGIGLGLIIGKTAGIFLAVLLAERTGFAARPGGASWSQILGLAALCGIGFTMSLFIAQLAFPGQPALVEEAKLGVLGGSVLAGLAGYSLLRLTRPR